MIYYMIKIENTSSSKKKMDTQKKVTKSKKPKCSLSGCNKKLDMTCVSCCECNLRFCFQHMNRHSHNCCEIIKTKERKKEELKASNPKVQDSTLEKI